MFEISAAQLKRYAELAVGRVQFPRGNADRRLAESLQEQEGTERDPRVLQRTSWKHRSPTSTANHCLAEALFLSKACASQAENA